MKDWVQLTENIGILLDNNFTNIELGLTQQITGRIARAYTTGSIFSCGDDKVTLGYFAKRHVSARDLARVVLGP